MNKELIQLVQNYYSSKDFIPLHAPVFAGNEKDYVLNTIDSTFVSSVGQYVDQFEASIESFTGAKKAVAVVNGTAGLHAALYLAGVKPGDIVITQALTFVATCNALHQLGAQPAFVDVSKVSLGLCPVALDTFLQANALVKNDGLCVHKKTHMCEFAHIL